MRKVLRASVAAAAMLATAAASNARAGTYIPVPMVPGAVSEIVFGINDSNVVAGSFRDSAGVEHGFFGPLDGSNWTTFDAPFEGTTGTEARGIANDGAITGIALNPNFKVGEEFYRTAKGKFKIFSLNGQPLDGVAQGIAKQNDKQDVTVGDYINATGMTAGYFGLNGKYQKGFKLHLQGENKSPQISPRGVDDFSLGVAGDFVDQTGVEHGFSQNRAAPKIETTQFDYPGASATALEDGGSQVGSGQWQDASGNFHAFIIVFNQGVVDLDPGDGSTSQQAWGVNHSDLVALSTSVGKSYIYCLGDDPKKCPPGGFTKPEHISRPLISRSVSLP